MLADIFALAEVSILKALRFSFLMAAMAWSATHVGSVSAFGQPAEAQCNNDDDSSSQLRLGAVVTSERRANFVLGGYASTPNCPNDTSSCRDKAYVVPGDLLIVGQSFRDFICATYISEKGLGYWGWLPKANVSSKPSQSHADLNRWEGHWRAPEMTIEIRRDSRGAMLVLKGEATFGTLNPERVKRGAINTGEFEATTKPLGDSLAFTVGDGQTLPYNAQSDAECSVRLRLHNDSLIVKDNLKCGGLNVTFSGMYRR